MGHSVYISCRPTIVSTCTCILSLNLPLIKYLTQIFNNSLELGIAPDKMNRSKITPIPKQSNN